jgi:hypothetical protein
MMSVRAVTVSVLITGLVCACASGATQHTAFDSTSPSEFAQPLPEPAIHPARNAPSGSSALARVHTSSMRSATFKVVGTETTPRPQGQIGAQVYHLNGKLTTQPAALELQPWDDVMTGLQPDIDGRGDFVSIGSTSYVRINTLNAWQVISGPDAYSGLFAGINPASWQEATNPKVLGEASIDGSATWVVQATDAFGRHFKLWLKESDGYPLRYTIPWVNARGSTYYINALYRQFNSGVVVTAPDTSNHGIVGLGTPVPLVDGSVTVSDVTFDCSGTAVRHPAPQHKFVLITLEFVDTGPGKISIARDDWWLYGDGVNGAASVDIAVPDLLATRILSQGDVLSGKVAFEVPEDVYQLWTVGKLVGTTAVVSTFLPILPSGQSPCA